MHTCTSNLMSSSAITVITWNLIGLETNHVILKLTLIYIGLSPNKNRANDQCVYVLFKVWPYVIATM